MLNKFFPENRTFYETTWKNLLEADRPQMTIRDNMAHAHCVLVN